MYEESHHIKNLIESRYYMNLVLLRSVLSKSIDDFFHKIKMPKVDLYMISDSVSSPMGPGSDSTPLAIRFDGRDTYLVDSAQFGMEPLVQKHFSGVYCYLPSFRGEKPDARHLNQFYHCEAELRADFPSAINIAEKMIVNVLKKVLSSDSVHLNKDRVMKIMQILKKNFLMITQDEAIEIIGNKFKYVEHHKFGKKITLEGEKKLLGHFGNNHLLWLYNFDRDIVAFYQKPNPDHKDKVIAADLLLPQIFNKGFYGEVLGLGQRQDSASEIVESIKRQKLVNGDQYNWYIEMRNNINYKSTSGFGLGIERLVSWILGSDHIADSSLYPVLRGNKAEY